jgi:hypothetical protein
MIYKSLQKKKGKWVVKTGSPFFMARWPISQPETSLLASSRMVLTDSAEISLFSAA